MRLLLGSLSNAWKPDLAFEAGRHLIHNSDARNIVAANLWLYIACLASANLPELPHHGNGTKAIRAEGSASLSATSS